MKRLRGKLKKTTHSNRTRQPLHRDPSLTLEALEARVLLSNLTDYLRITEINYHPGDPTQDELAINPTFADNDFEYIELQNISTTATLNLRNVAFTRGIDYTFTSSYMLAPGDYLVVVRNRNAFEARYDTTNINIAPGAFINSGLKDEGELIRLKTQSGTSGEDILEFVYNGEYFNDLNDDRVKDNNEPYLLFDDINDNGSQDPGEPDLWEDENNNGVYNLGEELFENWYPVTNGKGFSLTIVDPYNWDVVSWDTRSSWRPSSERDGTPGREDIYEREIVISEVLAHSDDPGGDWIELNNVSDHTVDIGGWFLSEDGESLKKYQIGLQANGSVIPVLIEPNSYIVFYDSTNFGDTSTDPGVRNPFGLSENGEDVFLSSAQYDPDLSEWVLDGFFEEKDFGASQVNVALGRYEKSYDTFNFVAMSSNTPGAENAYPKVGPIVINEIMYNPGNLLNDTDEIYEYLELFNISDQPVTFLDEITGQPWKFVGGLDYTFPTDTPITLQPGEFLYVVKSEAGFNSLYNAPQGTQIIQWGPNPATSNSLKNSGERIELAMPGDIMVDCADDNYDVYYSIRADRVNYSDGSHPVGGDLWPTQPDGPVVLASSALIRNFAFNYGNDVANWKAGNPLNSPPRIVSLQAQPGSIIRGNQLTLTATGVSDPGGSVDKVIFFHDTNENGIWDKPDTQLFEDNNPAAGWQANVSTSQLPIGTNWFFAVGCDNNGKWSNWASVTTTVNNNPPTVGTLNDSPDPVKYGDNLTLSITADDSDGNITKVQFYRDANGNGSLDILTDSLLKVDTDSSDGWNWTGSTNTFTIGTNTYFARAQDNNNAWSNTATTTGTVGEPPNYLPTITSLTDSPDPIAQGDNLTLTANGVSDGDGSVVMVEFYRDSNGNGSWDASDTTLGADSSASYGWNWTGSTSSFTAGTNTYFARAQDNDNAWGGTVTTTGTVNQPPTIASFTDSPDPIAQGDNLTLTASGVNDGGGSVVMVRFYRDSNGNHYWDVSDTILGADSNATDGWTVTISTSGFPTGVITYFARALDNEGAWSNTATTTGTVNIPPTIDSLTADPNPVIQGDDLTLTADGVYGAGGPISQVVFYRDSNDNGSWDASDATLGADYSSSGGWTVTIPIDNNFPPGAYVYFARARDNNGTWSNTVTTTGAVELPNIPPTMDLLTIDPDPIVRGDDLTLTAGGVSDTDGSISQVVFYRDSNSNGSWDASDTTLGADFSASGGWTVTISTSDLPVGDNIYFARAKDDGGAFSETVSATGRVVMLPTIDSITVDPDLLTLGEDLTLTAVNVTDSDGTVEKVEFYRRTAYADVLLGTDIDGADGWSWSGSTSGFVAGDNVYLARAQDNDQLWSNSVSATGIAQTFPVPAGQADSKTVQYTDADGSIVTVKISNGTAILHFEGKSLTTSVKGSTTTVIGETNSALGRANLAKIALQDDTTDKTSISFSVKQGDGDTQTTLGGLTGGTLGKLTGKQLDLAGDIVLTGSLSSLTIDDIFENASITTDVAAAKGIKIKVDNIDKGVVFDLAGTVNSFQATEFSGGSLIGDNIGTVTIKPGNLDADVTAGAQQGSIASIAVNGHITGNIMANGTIKKVVTKLGDFTGAARAGIDIGTFQAFNFLDGILSAGNNIGKVYAKGDIIDTYILSGYDIGKDCQPGTQDEGEGLNSYAATIGSVQVGRNRYFDGSYALAGVKPYKDDLSEILAPNGESQVLSSSGGIIKKATLGQVYIGNEDVGIYGLFAASEIGTVKFTEVAGLGLPDFQIRPPWL